MTILPPIRVLLVDDHKTMLWGLAKLIEGATPAMEVVGTAANCDQACAEADRLRPDVILLDLDLDGRNSVDILPGLLANGVSRVLVLTGSRDAAMLDQAVIGGVRGVMRKDAPPELVVKAIEKIHLGELWIDHDTIGRVFGQLLKPGAERRPDPESDKLATLTAKERKIIEAIVDGSGSSNKDLGQKLFLSEHTVRNHLTSVYQKLGVGNRLELYVYAVKYLGPRKTP